MFDDEQAWFAANFGLAFSRQIRTTRSFCVFSFGSSRDLNPPCSKKGFDAAQLHSFTGKEQMSVIHDVDATPPWQLVLTALVLILLPEIVGIALFSSIGVGARIAALGASDSMSMVGNATACLCALVLALAFVVDVHRRGVVVRVLIALMLAVCLLATAALKFIGYAWFCFFVCFGFSVALVAWSRVHCFKPADIAGKRFFESLAISFVLAALIVFGAWLGWQSITEYWWTAATRTALAEDNQDVYAYYNTNSSLTLNYTTHCSESNTAFLATLSTDDAAAVTSACQSSETVWFMQWAGPAAVGIGNVIVAAVSWVFSQAAASLQYDEDETEAHKVKRALKNSTGLVVLMLTLMYAAQYVSGANVAISSGLLALGAASVASIVGFILLEFGFQRLNEHAKKDRLAQNLMNMLKSEWMKALVVAGLNIFIPVMALLDRLRQKVRKATSMPSADGGGKFTVEGQKVVAEMGSWKWCSIFFKVNIVGLLGVSLLLGMKLTYVFFSWLNETLAAANLSFPMLCLMILGVALLMFLCPIVPGSAVYLFAGVVLGAQSQLEGGVGFPVGVVAGVLVCSICKMIACMLQYSMGYGMGKFVKVQQFVGVDKVPTRAMEQILKQRGLKIDKVAILVAGPDWPTSVLCGILRLNVPAMLLGTMPVILVSIIPQVLVGALLTYQDDSSGGIMSIISSSVTLAAAVVQALAMFFFTYRIMKVVDEDGEKLAQPREEHAAVAELTRQEQDYVQALKEVSEWGRLKLAQKITVLVSSFCILTASFLFMADYSVSEKFCFRKFDITSKIGDPYLQGGLDNSVINLVIVPVGWAALGLAFIGTLFHVVINKWLACNARSNLVSGTSRGDDVQALPAQSPSTFGKSYSQLNDGKQDTE